MRKMQRDRIVTPAHRSARNRFFFLPVFLLGTSLAVTGCSKEASAVDQSRMPPKGWTTICLGRYLIDLPPGMELGAAAPEYYYRGGHLYNFRGFDGSGSGDASSYSGHWFAETHPIPLEWQQDPKNNPSFAWIRGNAKIRYTDIKAEEKQRGNQKDFKLTGPINTDFPLSYAYNAAGVIEAGFYSPIDQRGRMFSANTEDQGGTFEQAEAVVNKLFTRYRVRAATDIPADPGVCTPYGFFADPQGETESRYRIAVPLRSTTYPNLLFVLHIRPAAPGGPATVDDLPNPNRISLKDVDALMLAALSGVKRSFGPDKTQLAGQPARVLGREYHSNPRGGGAAYDVVAEAVGQAGALDKPAITLSMAAALPFVEQPPKEDPFEPGLMEPWIDQRPLLKGTTPPFEEGMKVFHQVLASMRPRPGAIAATAGAAASEPSTPSK